MVFSEIKHASTGWVLVAVAASAMTYLGATISMKGADPTSLPTLHTFNTQVASSFANRLTPAQAGGYAVNIRFPNATASIPRPLSPASASTRSAC